MARFLYFVLSWWNDEFREFFYYLVSFLGALFPSYYPEILRNSTVQIKNNSECEITMTRNYYFCTSLYQVCTVFIHFK